MATFGFSIGDFIAGISLLKDVIGAFSDSRGARKSYKDVTRELSSLQIALQGIEKLVVDPDLESQHAALAEALSSCKACIEGFLLRISKFKRLDETADTSKWSSESFKRNVQKIEWALSKKWDVDQFRREIQVHTAAVVSLQSTLLSVQSTDQKKLAHEIQEALATQHKLIEDIHTKISAPDFVSSRDCLRALFVTDPSVDRKEIENRKDHLMNSSCQWILDNAGLRGLSETDRSDLLWIHGQPGKGKTMLAMFLIDHISDKISGNPFDRLVYFFCDNNSDQRNSTLYVLKSILHQVLRQSPKNVLLDDFHTQGPQMFSSVEAVWVALIRVLRASVSRTIFIVIDGLDECDECSLDILLSLASTYFETPEDTICNVKWIFTSRNDMAIRERLSSSWTVDLEANSAPITKAVDAFIELKVDELATRKRYDIALKQFVIENLREKAEGTFLWVALACSELRKRNVSSINTRVVLSKLPPGLSRLYARIYDQVMHNEMAEMVDIAIEVLRSMTIAVRPLSLTELAVMAGFPSEAFHKSSVAREYAEQCGSFITIGGEYVYFVHQSARDYLIGLPSQLLFSENLLREHESATRRCLDYICNEWNFGMKNLRTAAKAFTKEGKRPERADCPGLAYPLLHWIEHSILAGPNLRQASDVDENFFRSNTELRRAWIFYYQMQRHLPNLTYIRIFKFTALHISAVCGTCWLAERLLETGQRFVDVEDVWGLTPLHWAVQAGNFSVVKLLLNKGANPNHKGGFKARDGPRISTPLGLAISYGNLDMAKLLLSHGAEIDGYDNDSKTPLLWTITKGLPSLAEFLLENGANAVLRDYKTGRTPLHLATERGNETIVKILLSAGSFVGARDNRKLSPSHISAYRGFPNITKILNAYGARSSDADEALRMVTDAQSFKQLMSSAQSGSGPSRVSGSWFFRSPES